MQELKDGIYYDMPMDDYLSLPYMSSSGVTDMQISVGTFWANHVDPDREEKKTDATSFGTLFHTMILEPEKMAQYVIKPEGMNFSTKEGKQWKKEAVAEGLLIVTNEDMEKCELMKNNLHKSGLMKHFEDGLSEVTLIWSEGDVKCKARIDRLTDCMSIDLKTFSNSNGKRIDRAVCDSIGNYRYFIKSWFQHRGLTMCGLKDRRIVYVFVDSSGAPNVKAKEFGAQGFSDCNHYWLIAEGACMRAISTFVDYKNKYGFCAWIDEQHIEQLGDEDLPVYALKED